MIKYSLRNALKSLIAISLFLTFFFYLSLYYEYSYYNSYEHALKIGINKTESACNFTILMPKERHFKPQDILIEYKFQEMIEYYTKLSFASFDASERYAQCKHTCINYSISKKNSSIEETEIGRILEKDLSNIRLIKVMKLMNKQLDNRIESSKYLCNSTNSTKANEKNEQTKVNEDKKANHTYSS